MLNRTYIIGRTLEDKIAIAENIGQNTMIVTLDVLKEILTLLKEHEAIVPKRIDGKQNHFIKCGNCNRDLMSGYHYCPYCGRAVKWD